MAAIDKTYVDNWEDWKEVTDWMKSFERKLPNGSILRGKNFLYYPNATKEEIEEWIKKVNKEVPIMNTSWTMDYFLIRECPLEVVQNRMQSVYYKEEYEAIKNGTSEYDTFVRPIGGKHLKLIKEPKFWKLNKYLWNDKIRKDKFIVDVDLPKKYGTYSWYYNDIDYWSMPYELIAGRCSSSADVCCNSHKALIRKILKWNLPIGTKVYVSHFRFQGGECEFIVKK